MFLLGQKLSNMMKIAVITLGGIFVIAGIAYAMLLIAMIKSPKMPLTRKSKVQILPGTSESSNRD